MAEDRFGGSNGVVFTNVRIIDGSGDYPYTGEVVIQGNRIRQVNRGSSRLSPGIGGGGGQTVIDGMGATLMPGLLRRAPSSVLEQRARHRSDPDDAAGGAHAGHRADGQSSCSTPASPQGAARRRPSRASTSSCATPSTAA